ncbi:hypothetical protein MTO96_018574 [Rhipicephalus appendiculatus]
MQKLLKTGIAAASENSNVFHRDEAGQNNGALVARQQTPRISTKLPEEAVHVLECLKRTNVPASLPTLKLSATVYVGGYIARIVMEPMDCENCCAVTTKALSNQPLQQFVRPQDKGGLLYPSDKLLYVLETLRQFVETALQNEPRLQKPLKTLLEAAVPAVSNSALLKCKTSDSQHHKDLAVLICTRFIRPLLVNYASTTTDKNDVYKTFFQKPLSRKYVKL